MIFWDTSAIVPLLVAEEPSARCTRLLRSDPSVVVWGLAPVEALSAIQRRVREGHLTPAAAGKAMARLNLLRDAWSEVRDLELVARRAERILSLHPLRAADSLQLAAVLIACEERPERIPFACLDSALAAAARREGFRIVP